LKNFKTIAATLIFVLAFAGCASAGITDLLQNKNKVEYSTKSAIPQAEPIEYKGLKIGGGVANITIVNKSDTATYKFSTACEFLDQRGWTLGDFFIPETTIGPKQAIPLKGLNFNGDTTKAKANAKALNWTIYKLEEVK